MSEKTIKHFVFIPFFTWQNRNYPYDVLDVDFLIKQLPLAKNALMSLENQTNKNFEVYFSLHDKAFSDKKYEFISATLSNFTTLSLTFIKSNKRPSLVKDALNEYDFVIQSRMDLDDFIYKDAVADTQNKIDECEDVLSYGYCRGYEYIYGQLYPHYIAWSGKGHINIFQSLILKSVAAKKLPPLCISSFYHDKFKPMLEEYLTKRGATFSESMFKQDLTTNAYIYFRHGFSQEQLTRYGANSQIKIPIRKHLLTKDITKKQLEEEFGFFHELNSIK